MSRSDRSVDVSRRYLNMTGRRRLTVAEARALQWAARNFLDDAVSDGDERLSLFNGDAVAAAAAVRAFDKVCHAAYMAELRPARRSGPALPACDCGGPAMGTGHSPDCAFELAAKAAEGGF